MTLALGATTVGSALAEVARRLAAAGIDETRREARLIVAAALGWQPMQVLGRPEAALDGTLRQRVLALADRRARREPLSRLLGYREFWSLRFALSPETFDPRPDSETLIEAALAALPDRAEPCRVLDLGTGTGCLLLALLSELPNAVGVGVDRSAAAVATARQNAQALGLSSRAQLLAGDWGAALGGAWDVILANPPYIPSGGIGSLMPEVARHEPRPALDGGPDGLDAYRALAPEISRLLAPAGLAFLELGLGQKAAVMALLAGVGLAMRATRPDLSGVDRCLVAGRV